MPAGTASPPRLKWRATASAPTRYSAANTVMPQAPAASQVRLMNSVIAPMASMPPK